VRTVFKIAKALGMTLADLFSELGKQRGILVADAEISSIEKFR
jgi:hypothetical protein